MSPGTRVREMGARVFISAQLTPKHPRKPGPPSQSTHIAIPYTHAE